MERIGQTLFSLNSVDSTNNYAMAQLHAGMAKHGQVYLAREQTAGRGQRGKAWVTEPGQNIIFTAVLQPAPIPYTHQFYLSACISLACYDLLNPLTAENIKIKWPNDIYWCDRKAGGILIENVLQGNDWKFAVAGIGLNINQTSFPELSRAVSLRQITGKLWDIRALVTTLCERMESRYQALVVGKYDQILREYNDVLYKAGKPVRLKKQNVLFEAVIKEVNADGKMITVNGTEQEFSTGEIEWVT